MTTPWSKRGFLANLAWAGVLLGMPFAVAIGLTLASCSERWAGLGFPSPWSVDGGSEGDAGLDSGAPDLRDGGSAGNVDGGVVATSGSVSTAPALTAGAAADLIFESLKRECAATDCKDAGTARATAVVVSPPSAATAVPKKKPEQKFEHPPGTAADASADTVGKAEGTATGGADDPGNPVCELDTYGPATCSRIAAWLHDPRSSDAESKRLPPVDPALLELAYLRNCVKVPPKSAAPSVPDLQDPHTWGFFAALALALFPFAVLALGRARSPGADPDRFLPGYKRVFFESAMSRALLTLTLLVGWLFVFRHDPHSLASAAARDLRDLGFRAPPNVLYPWPHVPSAVITAGFMGWYLHLATTCWYRYTRGDVVSRRIPSLFLRRLLAVLGAVVALSLIPNDIALPLAFLVGVFPMSAVSLILAMLEKLGLKGVRREEFDPVSLLDLPGASRFDVRRLEEEGIESVTDLAIRDPDELREALPVYGRLVHQWCRAARLAVALDQHYATAGGPASLEDYRAAFAELKANRRWQGTPFLLPEPEEVAHALGQFPRRLRSCVAIELLIPHGSERPRTHSAIRKAWKDLERVGWHGLHIALAGSSSEHELGDADLDNLVANVAAAAAEVRRRAPNWRHVKSRLAAATDAAHAIADRAERAVEAVREKALQAANAGEEARRGASTAVQAAEVANTAKQDAIKAGDGGITARDAAIPATTPGADERPVALNKSVTDAEAAAGAATQVADDRASVSAAAEASASAERTMLARQERVATAEAGATQRSSVNAKEAVAQLAAAIADLDSGGPNWDTMEEVRMLAKQALASAFAVALCLDGGWSATSELELRTLVGLES